MEIYKKRLTEGEKILFILLIFPFLQVLANPFPRTSESEPCVQEVQTGSSLMPTPELPRQALKVAGVHSPTICLNGEKGKGEWEFLFQVPDYRTSGIPLPGAENQDFDFSVWNDLPWSPIRVPGEALMQGFNIAANVEYYYRRRIAIPADYRGKRILLRFDGVYCNARVWVNGRYVRTHVGGFTTWDCDITEYAVPGESLNLVVGVADIFSLPQTRCPGIWNPRGRVVSNPSAASWYAHHNIGGILRDVSLLAFPRTHLLRTYIETDLDTRFLNAKLKVTLQLMQQEGKRTEVELQVIDTGSGKPIAVGQIPFGVASCSGPSASKQITLPVKAPRLWDAEHPNLYLLKTILRVDGLEVQTNGEKFGFREIHYGGRDGTDLNKVYVNGREVKLRGTCRHDVSADLGRSITREEAFEEIAAFKRVNINHIRTSHYPVSEDLLDACDEYGIYVEEESAVAFIGQQIDPLSTRFEEYGPQFAEMIERDRNRPSILIWSIGNENWYDKMNAIPGGNPILRNRNYLKEVDSSRPCIWSYVDRAYATLPQFFSDIYSKHYNSVDQVDQFIDHGTRRRVWPRTPVLHDEFAHVACYNLDELCRDHNARNFWGESIKRGWENIFRGEGQLGCALWGGIDDVFFIPKGTQGSWLRDGRGQMVGWGEWGSVLDVYKREKPEAYLVKKAFSPVLVDESRCRLKGGILHVPVQNRFDHTDLNELRVGISVDQGKERIARISKSIPPHGEGVLALPLGGAPGRVHLRFLTGKEKSHAVDEYRIDLAEEAIQFTPPSEEPPLIVWDDPLRLSISGKNFTVRFDRTTGLISEALYRGRMLLKGGPRLEMAGHPVGDWTLSTGGLKAQLEGSVALVTIRGHYASAGEVIFELRISSDGIIDTSYTLKDGIRNASLSLLGFSYTLAEETHHIRWKRKGLYSFYPDGHIGRNEGRAFRLRTGTEVDRYGVKPSWPWKDDMKEFFIASPHDTSNGKVTRDFKALREHIQTFSVHGGENEDAPHVVVESPDARGAAQIRTSFIRGGCIDDSDVRIKYNGKWTAGRAMGSYSGTEHWSTTAGDFCEITFRGDGITFIGAKQSNVGRLRVYLDNVFKEEIETYSDLGNVLKQNPIYTVDGLENGEHTLRIEVAPDSRHCIVIDAFQIHSGNRDSNGTNTCDLLLVQQWNYPGLRWGNYTGVPIRAKPGTTGSGCLRLTDRSVDQGENGKKVSSPPATNTMKLWYDKPALNWARNALPVGNGYVGGMVYGKTEVEDLQVNEISLWSGGPNSSPHFTGGNKKGAWTHLKEIRRKMLNGEAVDCTPLCGNSIGWSGYQNLGNISIDFSGAARTRAPKDYRRELDLNEGLVRVSYENKGVRFVREHFASHPGNVLVSKLTASRKGSLGFRLAFHPDTRRDGDPHMPAYHNVSKRFTLKAGNQTITCLGEQLTSRMKFAVCLKVIAPHAEVTEHADGTLTVAGASEAVIIMAAGTNYDIGEMANIREIADYHTPDGDFLDNSDPDGSQALRRASERVETASRLGYGALLKRHLQDYRALYGRTSLDLGMGKDADIPTDELLKCYHQGRRSSYLEGLLFQMGRYMLISSSRDGVLPANLQGLWNDSNSPEWACDYHFNVNLQMNYWPAFVCNLAETAEPLLSYVNAIRPLGNLTAREHFGVKHPEAWVCTTASTPLGFLGVGWGFIWGWTPGSAAWICNNLWDYYRFTLSREVLERVYPVMRGASLFWREFLIENPQNPAELITVPSTSSEHGRAGIGATYDLSLAKMLLLDTVEAATLLGRDVGLAKEFARLAERIHPYQIGADGQLKEWREESRYNRDARGVPIGEFGHRHMSHLLGLHPGTLITRNKRSLMQAAIRALELRGDGSGCGTGGWSMAQKINLWARAGRGEKAYRYLSLLLDGGINPNLFDTIGPFQIEGNLGATAGIAEMLLQSHGREIEPLPALPASWDSGSYKGLVARGNFECDAIWRAGNLVRFTLRSLSGGECRIAYPGLSGAHVTCGGVRVQTATDGRNILSFTTERGKSYTVDQIPVRLSPPRDVQAFRRNDQTVLLAWSPVPGAEAYRIYRAEGGTKPIPIALSKGKSEYLDTVSGRERGKTDFYRIVAIGKDGREGWPSAAVGARGVATGIVDDTSPYIQYRGSGWSASSRADDSHLNTQHYTNREGDSCEVVFEGTGIEFYTRKQVNTDSVDVYIDGDRRAANLPLFSNPPRGKFCAFRIDNLPSGVHTLKLLKPEGDGKNPAVRYVVVDFFKVLK